MMLTNDLLRVKVNRKEVTPSFVRVDEPHRIAQAESVLTLFERAIHQGWRRHEIDAEVRRMTQNEVDHKFTRGLIKLMLDRSKFSNSLQSLDKEVSSAEFRRHVFSVAAQSRKSGGSIDRDSILQSAGVQFNLEDPDDALYGDLKEMQRIEDVRLFECPIELLHRYNVALCQACLLHASKVTLFLESPTAKWIRHAFRTMKFHGLLFEAKQEGETLEMTLDGPQSLLRLSTKYGIKMANYLPNILLQPGEWRLEGQLRWGKKRKTDKFFSLSSDMNLRSHYKPTGVWTSRAESVLIERFKALDHEWTVEEGHLLLGGGQRIFVPDCCFQRGDKKAYLEILGFWRRKSLKKHLEQMPDNMFLAVSKRLLGEKGAVSTNLDPRIIPFGEVISLPKLMKKLEDFYDNY